MSELLQCFVIAPIGKEGSDIRLRSDKILNHILRPVALDCGYRTVRADEISEPGSITTQIIDHVLNDPMVIADLTGSNANVFYELAIRHVIRKPYVQIIQKGERIPFDVAGMRTVEIDHTDLDSVAQAKEEIKKQITHTAKNPTKVESPVSTAIDFESLRRSGDPEKRQLADIMTAVQNLGKTVIYLAKKLEALPLSSTNVLENLLAFAWNDLPTSEKLSVAERFTFEKILEGRDEATRARFYEALNRGHGGAEHTVREANKGKEDEGTADGEKSSRA